MAHVRSASCALAVVAVLTGVTAQAATAAPASHSSDSHEASHRIPFTAAEVTAQDKGSYKITWKAPGVKHVALRADGRIVASGGSAGSVTVRGLPATVDRQWFDLVPHSPSTTTCA